TSTSTTTTTSTSTTTTTSTTVPEPPPITAGYIVDPAEVEVSAKQLAVDVALALTTYEQDQEEPESDVESADALPRPGYWSRGSVVYPRDGGLRGDRASVMVVTRQIIGQGGETLEETARTLDVRLVKDEAGVWQFDSLASD